MKESKYLYGASVQGIQGFIFKTNKLIDIVGASELVEKICRELFLKVFFTKEEISQNAHKEWEKSHRIISAAGNVKYILNEEECKKAVLNFPRMAMTAAPGITVSQAVVNYDNRDFGDAVNELEAKLREQRNRPAKSLTIGLLGMERSRTTGLPIRVFADGKKNDASSYAKYKAQNLLSLSAKSFLGIGKEYEVKNEGGIAYEISDITSQNDWIAVIHADGNSLGQVVQHVGHKKDEYSKFSQSLDAATIHAANDAYLKVRPTLGWKDTIPIRPVVLGGDDMTVIIRGDLAIPYVNEYIKKFEKYTGEGDLGEIIKSNKVFTDGTNHLSACAGVAFIKSSYPFYYGYQLAEELCTAAKSVVKKGLHDGEPVKSCLMFHKIQDSFITSYSDIVKRELSPKDGSSLQFGPYFIKNENHSVNIPEGYISIDTLEENCKRLTALESVRTGLRQWLTLLHDGNGSASQHLARLKDINNKEINAKDMIDRLTTEYHGSVAAGDCLALYTVMNQKTKED